MTLLGTTLRRSRSQWRLLTAVLSVSILACTLVASLGMLIPATEQAGVRGSLSAMDPSQTNMYVQLVRPKVPIDEATVKTTDGVASVLAPAATATGSSVALSLLLTLPSENTVPWLSYFGEMDTIQSHATLVDGTWATPPDPATPTIIPVALPQTAATALGMTIGSTVTLELSRDETVTAVVVGTYAVNDATERYWSPDPLHGEGENPFFIRPGVALAPPTQAFGPLIAAPGAIDGAGVRVLTIDYTYQTDFTHTTVAQLIPLAARAFNADVALDKSVQPLTDGVFYTSELSDALYGVGTGLIVTRTTVVVISLLLLLLAVIVVSQTARLLSESRTGERQLMRARGASRGRIIGFAALEALALGLITVLVSPLLAGMVYRVLAAQPAMVTAGMPASAGLPLLAWQIAVGVTLAFIVVLLAPVVRRADGLTELAGHGRQRANGGLVRSGLDIALAVVAAIAYWQLLSYRSPVSTESVSLDVDPILVAGPAIVLLACALLCMRLIPLAARLVDRLAQRSRGAILPLAAWEIGRRTQRATAAVLLLSLTLGVGTFGLSFLATWRQSQLDQATVAVGAPVRVPAVSGEDPIPAEQLADGATGDPQPTMRRAGRIGGTALGGQFAPSGIDAAVIGLTSTSRGMLDRGRSAEEGGTTVAAAIPSSPSVPTGIAMAAGAVGVAAEVQAFDADGAGMNSISVNVVAILEDAAGLMSTIDLGAIEADGEPHQVEGEWQVAGEVTTVPGPVRLVGLQTTTIAADGAIIREKDATILIGSLASLMPKADDPKQTDAVLLPANIGTRWFTHNPDETGRTPTLEDVPAGWQFDLSIHIPPDLATRPAQFIIIGWQPSTALIGVVTEGFASNLTLGEGSSTRMVIGAASLDLLVVGTTNLIPGVADADQLVAGNTALASSSRRDDVVVVDQDRLQRILLQSGATGSMVDEWWVDVPPGTGSAYLARHAEIPGARSSDVLGADLQQAPIRVATQAALWLAIAAGALLAAVGFAVHATTTVRARRLELAQLRAIGLSRAKVVGLVGAESFIVCLLGTIFGIGVGVLLVFLVGPLVAVSPGGAPPVPSVIVEIPWLAISLLVIGLAAVLGMLVVGVARLQRNTEPAELLREGNDR